MVTRLHHRNGTRTTTATATCGSVLARDSHTLSARFAAIARKRAPTTATATAVGRHRQRGIVALEFALMFTFALLPLLLLTFSGVLTFYAQQGLTLAAADGARAALRYPAGATSTQTTMAVRVATAEAVAAKRMGWLLNATDQPAAASSAITATPARCAVDTSIMCITVTTRALCSGNPSPFCWWMLKKTMGSRAIVQVADAPLTP